MISKLQKISEVVAVEKARSVRPLTEINERECVAKLATEVFPNGLIVEIGCLYGGMTAVMGLANPAAKIIAVDNFSWHPADDVKSSRELVLKNMDKLGVRNVEVLEGDSIEIGKEWKDQIELLWVDGAHSFEYAFEDICNYGKWAEVMAVHDFDNPHLPDIRKAVERFVSEQPDWEIDEVVGTVVVLRRG